MPQDTQPTPLQAEYDQVDVQEPVADDEADVTPTPRDDKGRFVKTEPVVEAPKHSPFLARQATEIGLSADEIGRYTPDQLEAVVEREWKKVRSERDKLSQRDLRQQEPSGVPLEFAEDAPAAPKPAASQDDFDLPESDYDPKIVKAFNTLKAQNKALLDRLDKIEPRVNETHGHMQAQVYLTQQQQSDRWFGDHAEMFGTGTRADLTDGDHLQRRIAFDKLAVSMSKKGDTIATAYDRAYRTLYGDKPAKVEAPAQVPAKPVSPVDAERTITSREQAWSKGGVAAPSQQTPEEEPKGPKRAARTANAWLRRQAEANSTEYSELPQ